MSGTEAINALLHGVTERNEIPGLVAAVADSNHVLYHSGFGKLNVANQKEMAADAIFQTMSMTKPVISAAIMMLYEQGELGLDDPVSKYLPSLADIQVIDTFNEADSSYTVRPAKTAVTIRHLLTQTSGFGYGFCNSTLRSLEQTTGLTPKELPLLHEPGSRWAYGMGTRILGEVVVALSGMTLEEFFRSKIFGPLGMKDTSYGVSPENQPRRATLHQRENGRLMEQPLVIAHPPPAGGRDGGLCSTAADYLLFLQMFLNGGTLDSVKILNESSIAMMTKNQIGGLTVELQYGVDPGVCRDFPLGVGRDKFGLGFQITALPEEAGHAGNSDLRSPGSYSWAGLYNTHFWVDPARGLAAVILMQVLPFFDETCISVYQKFEGIIGKNYPA